MEFCDSLSRRLDSTQRKGACFDFFGMLRDCMLRAGPLCVRTFRAKSMCSCLSFLTPSLTVTQEGVAARRRGLDECQASTPAPLTPWYPFLPRYVFHSRMFSRPPSSSFVPSPSAARRHHVLCGLGLLADAATLELPPAAELGAGPMPDVREVLDSRWDGGSLRHRGRPRWTAPTPAA